MNVLALTRSFPSPHDPLHATYNLHHFKALSEEVALDLVVPVPWQTKLVNSPETRDYRGLAVSFPTFWYLPGFARHWHGAAYEKSVAPLVRRLAARRSIDVIYATFVYPDGLAAAALAEKMGNVPVVIRAIGSDVHSIPDALKSCFVGALHRADHVIVVSKDLSQRVQRLGISAENVTTVYNGVDSAQFSPVDRAQARSLTGLSNGGPTYCAVARLHPVKALDVLVRAFARLDQPEASLVLVGDGPEQASLQALGRELGLGDRLVFAGAVPYDQIRLWMAASDAVVLSSLDEGVPNVLVEALSTGVPVVSTDVGGVSEVIRPGEHGELVPPGDIAALADALRRVAARSWDAGQLRQSVANLSWEQNAVRTREVLESVRRGAA